MNAGSHGAVEGDGCMRVVVVEGGTQLMRFMLSAKVEPMGQSWACGPGGGGAEAGAGDDEVGIVGVILLSTSLCGWYRSGM